MTARARAIAIHSFVAAMGMALAAGVPAAEGDPMRNCLVAAKKRADKGDGLAAKALAVHYGDKANADTSPSLAWRYLRQAIEKGVDVSDVPAARGSITSYCSRDPELARLLEAKPAPAGKKGGEAKPVRVPQSESAAQRATPVGAAAAPAAPPGRQVAMPEADMPRAGVAAQPEPPAVPEARSARDTVAAEASPRTIVASTRLSGAAIELERQAADSEWSGNVRGAIPYWEKARQLGSKAAARRLYQIFSFGAGDVEADYVKAIEAHQYAQQMGIEVPPLPRK